LRLLLLNLCLASLQAQDLPTIRVPVRLVTVPTLVFSQGNRLIPGLEAADFRVLDKGRSQQITVEEASAPLSVAIAIQANEDVRAYLPFIAKTGNVVDALLSGGTGEAAVLTYGSAVNVVKPFDSGDVDSALREIRADGKPARMIDAGMRAVSLLSKRPAARSRILLFIGQARDTESESKLMSLEQAVEKENITVYCLALPEVGRAFVSDTFSLTGAEKGGFKAGVDLGRLISVLARSASAADGSDPFSVLTAATGGTEVHFRSQHQLEDGIAAIGVEARSAYVLSYYPNSQDSGYHTVKVEVDISGAKVYSRPGYWLRTD